MTLSTEEPASAKTRLLVDNFLAPVQILDFTSADTTTHAQVRAALEKAGTLIGPLDTFIAAHALSRELTLVTNNLGEFRRVRGLQLANRTS